jgi:uroporphyrinogen-III decarboxylase
LQVADSGLAGRSASEDARAHVALEARGHFILNAACAIPPSTPAENLRAFVETAREEGIYD